MIVLQLIAFFGAFFLFVLSLNKILSYRIWECCGQQMEIVDPKNKLYRRCKKCGFGHEALPSVFGPWFNP